MLTRVKLQHKRNPLNPNGEGTGGGMKNIRRGESVTPMSFTLKISSEHGGLHLKWKSFIALTSHVSCGANLVVVIGCR